MPSRPLPSAANLIAGLAHAVVVTDVTGRILAVNHRFTEVTGYTSAEALGQNPRMLHSGRHDRAFYEAMWACLRGEGSWHGEIWNRRADGSTYPEWLAIGAVRNRGGRLTHYVGTFTDITRQKHTETELQHVASHDALTGLYNRGVFCDHLTAELSRLRGGSARTAVLMVDLDKFKRINDTFGHVVGDRVLRAVAAGLCDSVRESDIVSRIGGDEFALLLPGATASDAEHVAAEIVRRLPRGVADAAGHAITASVGIAMVDGNATDADAVLECADSAMYIAKARGGGCWSLLFRVRGS